VVADFLYVMVVGPAAAAKNVKIGQELCQVPVFFTEFRKIAAIKFFRIIEFGVTFLRSV
jgi:hypothetical protein